MRIDMRQMRLCMWRRAVTWFLDEVTTEVIHDEGGCAAIAYGRRSFVLPGDDADDVAASLPGALAMDLGGDYGPVEVALTFGDPRGRATWAVAAMPDRRERVSVQVEVPASLAWRMQRAAGPWPVDLSGEIPFLLVDSFPSCGLRPEVVEDARARMRASVDDWAGVMRILVLECGVGPREFSEAFGLGIPTVLHYCKGTSEPHHLSRHAMLDRIEGLLAKRAADWDKSRDHESRRVAGILARLGSEVA